ncbi:MAG: 30S ribosomal protein S6 [Firmicutes bacterium]|nr:30S ribosomal protein S6 [Bacillota bacterium]
MQINKYELMTIISTGVSEAVRDKAIARVEEVIAKTGSTLEKTDKWGVRKLAYPINYRNDGFYVLFTFKGQPTAIAEIERIIRITDGYVRFMTTKLDEVAIEKSNKRRSTVKPRQKPKRPPGAPSHTSGSRPHAPRADKPKTDTRADTRADTKAQTKPTEKKAEAKVDTKADTKAEKPKVEKSKNLK